ncbi:Enoyl-CoA hydratase/carnithine racemase [Desulfatibacillum alkenivorans DSM 16219]|jgi:enoyl-CoA hydratase/carnithine racemase|uniref:Enoyl-CoA hydratase/carnithine racemase n=1 Tax=Desulfatibacillum alkenivorans DSM 16219 TaxID=1121393 RepID=A0A1M6I749_9BACT|nr:enoyl-CoA hydratase/isomerase family protein [Desulfatibacillum alkenivorans]SHJ30279.1 Enoyl-CoA hydratase/carnithine racemase [Desulfatibacillum alkenivorans DSM 16219]
MSDSPVLFEAAGGIALITLNRPDNRNSMNAEVLPAFQEAMDQVQAQKGLRCLIITGSGKSFCAGMDFHAAFPEDGALPNQVFEQIYKPFLAVADLPFPVIGALNGHAIGGGFGLAMMCDIRMAALEGKYGANFARLGIHSGMAVSYVLPRLVGLSKANELLFTGRLFGGAEALEIGWASYALPREEVLPKARELAREIAMSAPVAVQMMKRSIYKGLDWKAREAAEWEAHCQSRTFEMEDAKEGVAALLEKRPPNFKGR